MPTIYSSTPAGSLQAPKSGDGFDKASSTLEAMKAARRWLVWKYGPKPNGKKPGKLPHYVGGSPRSKPLDVESDWKQLVGFEEAVAFCTTHPEYRVGFALGPDGKSYWQGLDFDNTLQGADALPGYVEKSPSGVGYHAIGYGQHYHAYTEKFEAYASGRFFTFTGEQLSDGPLYDFSEFISSHHAKQDEHIAAVEQEVRGYSLEQLLDAVNAIPNDDLHWEVWNKIGMALWAAAGAGGRARALGAWMMFSAKSEKLFDARETLDRWEHYERSPASKIGAGTIIWLARQAGWKAAPVVERKAAGLLVGAPGPFTGEEEPDEFVIENFILVGLAVLYGPYGSGKTTAIIALMLHAAGVIAIPGLPRGIPRRVVYVSEFARQIRSSVKGYERKGMLLCSVEEANRRVGLIDAALLDPEVWAAEIKLLLAEVAAGHSGDEWWPEPLVVFDTGPANLRQQKLEDNTETYKNLSILGQALAGTSASLWIVLHTAKAQRNAGPEVLTALGAQAWGAASIGEVKVTREDDALLVSLGRTKFELVEDDAGRAIDQYRVETERLPPVALATVWGERYPHLAEQKKTVRIVVAFEPTTSADTRADREEKKDVKRENETTKKIRDAMYKAHKEGKRGICIAEPGGEGGYPVQEIDGYVVVANRSIFGKRATVEERTAFLEAEAKAASCDKRDGYYFFKYQNLYGLGRP